MLECPSCQQDLPPGAHFCAKCGTRLLARTNSPFAESIDELKNTDAVRDILKDGDVQDELISMPTERFVLQFRSMDGKSDLKEQSLEPSATTNALAAPYAYEKRELALHSKAILSSMKSLLPFVYENHRAENDALFESTLACDLPLGDAVWGRIAFVLGAYGNYMYRYPLDRGQRQSMWHALIWAVFYERCYRRKYLAQRFQNLLHFFQGSAENGAFLAESLRDLNDLRPYLEINNLKKLLEVLQQLADPPVQMLQEVGEQLLFAQQRRQEALEALDGQEYKQEQSVEVDEHSSAQQEAMYAADPTGQVHPVRQGDAGMAPVLQEAALARADASLDEITANMREVLSFFTSQQCQEFLATIRSARLDRVNQILQSVRQPLLQALRKELTLAGKLEYQSPRRPIRLGKKNADRFPEARRLLSSQFASEQQLGLRFFEQGERETTHPDYLQLAREWMLFARATVQGSPRVVDDWESDLQRGVASWEEIWNLAAFYEQTGYPPDALRVLQPALDDYRAPVGHLRLALTSALHMILEPGRYGAHAQQLSYTFLLSHLEHWPHPLSYLAWLILVQEARGPLHPRQQSQRLSTFQELLECALSLPDPQKDLSENRVSELEQLLVDRARCEEAWFFWINDYAERHSRKYPIWTRLAETSEHLGRLEQAEQAFQHLVEIQYHHDYSHYQEGQPLPRAEYLRRNLEKLFEFYQRHNLGERASDSFHSCYPSLRHLWEPHDPANRKLIGLTRPYLAARKEQEEKAAREQAGNAQYDLNRVNMPLDHFHPDQRVGIFIDYENIARFIPSELDAEVVGHALVDYASQLGEVVCLWASASPQNISNLADVRTGLEAAQFKVRFPRRELQFSRSSKNLADFALLECLSEAAANERPDVYLIVSGDRDYYERICSLLDSGHTVRVIASADSQHLSLKYRELEQQRARERQVSGREETSFFIDDLEEILRAYPRVFHEEDLTDRATAFAHDPGFN